MACIYHNSTCACSLTGIWNIFIAWFFSESNFLTTRRIVQFYVLGEYRQKYLFLHSPKRKTETFYKRKCHWIGISCSFWRRKIQQCELLSTIADFCLSSHWQHQWQNDNPKKRDKSTQRYTAATLSIHSWVFMCCEHRTIWTDTIGKRQCMKDFSLSYWLFSLLPEGI